MNHDFKKASGQENEISKFYWEKRRKTDCNWIKGQIVCLYFCQCSLNYNAHFTLCQRCLLRVFLLIPFSWSVYFVAAYLRNRRNETNHFFLSLEWSIILIWKKKANFEQSLCVRFCNGKWRDANEINTMIYYLHHRFTPLKLNSFRNCQQQQPDGIAQKCDGKNDHFSSMC